MVSAVQGAIPGARLSAAQRREQFLDVAAQIVVEQGADAVTMEAVAARAGVSKALSYRYFDNAGALLVSLFDREVVDLDQRIMAAVENVRKGSRRRSAPRSWDGAVRSATGVGCSAASGRCRSPRARCFKPVVSETAP